jgi:hypothetical protein
VGDSDTPVWSANIIDHVWMNAAVTMCDTVTCAGVDACVTAAAGAPGGGKVGINIGSEIGMHGMSIIIVPGKSVFHPSKRPGVSASSTRSFSFVRTTSLGRCASRSLESALLAQTASERTKQVTSGKHGALGLLPRELA